MEIGKLSVSELRKLLRRVEGEIKRREDTAKRDLLKKMQRLAADHGMSLDDVVGRAERPAKAPRNATPKPARAAKPKKITVAPKYSNPDDASMTWTGRGRKPLWVQKALEEGKSLQDLLIAKA